MNKERIDAIMQAEYERIMERIRKRSTIYGGMVTLDESNPVHIVIFAHHCGYRECFLDSVYAIIEDEEE